MNFLFALAASSIVSLVSLIGIIAFILNEKLLNKLLIIMVAFSAGTLIGGAFLHLIPEAFESTHNTTYVFLWVIIGFTSFFILEKYLYWRHCHDTECTVHAFTYLNLIGDAVHNFIDGLIIGGSFFVSPQIGIVSTLSILLHEIPHELGNFGVLVYGGFSKFKAVFFNFLTALTAILGTIVGFYFSMHLADFSIILLAFAAGGFIYIAGSDLIPELHEVKNRSQSLQTMITFILGLVFMYVFASGGHSH
jgi:zinc and cadmium transporter